MKRIAFGSFATLLALVLIAPSALAQTKPTTPAKPAAQAPPAPATAAPAKWAKPIKGVANIEVLQGPSKRVGNDVVTLIKVKNMSDGAIALMQIDEYWYDKDNKVVSGDSQKWRKPFNPGEVIEITMKSPYVANVQRSNYMFSHANGQIKAKAVKKFDSTPPPAK